MTTHLAGRDWTEQVTATPWAEGGGLPLFVTPSGPELRDDPAAVARWFAANREGLFAAATAAGALVLRGFAVRETADFARLVADIPPPSSGYAGGATPRGSLAEKVFESTKYPPQYKLPLHQEMAYLPSYPSKVIFFSRIAAETGGETTIGDMRRFGAQVPEEFARALRARGVRYIRNYRDPAWSTGNRMLDDYHRPWPDAMGTADRAEAEAIARGMGMEPRWEDNGSLSLIYVGPGYIAHPETGEEVWFNQLVSQFYAPEMIGEERFRLNLQHYGPGAPQPVQVSFGDGTPFDSETIVALSRALHAGEVAFPWQAGDVMILDNFHTAHGRNPFTGQRDTQVALVA
ncbi:MAG: TauD/TfdA family dioxygenase [Novosphingobium sp.]|nr:TauD/TfdA family dioxygenase [Novosphingobium sp.]